MKRKSLRHQARIFAVALPLFLLVTGCSTNKNTQNIQEAAKDAESAEQVDPPEISILTDPRQREYILKNCTSDTLDYSTIHGSWWRAKDCNMKISETIPLLRLSSILLNSMGDITGIKLITADGVTANQLKYQYGLTTTAPSGKSCVKFGTGTLPFLTIVDKQLCDALEYRQL